MVAQASKLTLAVLAALLGWQSPTPPDFWSGLGHTEERAFHASLVEAVRAFAANDLPHATAAAQRAAERMPDRFEGNLLLGLAFEELGRPEAAASFAAAYEASPGWARNPIGADYASRAFARVGSFDRAAELACAAARTMDPSSERAELFERCGAALMAVGPANLEAARRALELGEPERPSPRYVVLLAMALDRGGAHEHALAMLRPLAVRALDEHVPTFIVGTQEDREYAIALLSDSVNRGREALAAYERAAARGPWRDVAAARSRGAAPAPVTERPRPR